jgi:hypothetical protein
LTELTLPLPTRCANALLAMVPPLPPSFGREDNTHSMNTDSSPTVLSHAICQALKARLSLDRPLPASCTGGKDIKSNSGNNDGNSGGGGQEGDHAPDWDGDPLPPPSGSTMATRVAGE